MKVTTNIRAGKGQNRKQSSSTDSVDAPDPVVVYYPPVARCVGI